MQNLSIPKQILIDREFHAKTIDDGKLTQDKEQKGVKRDNYVKKKVKKGKKKKKKKTIAPSKTTIESEKNTNDEFNLDKLGFVKYAKEHQSANRPLTKLREFLDSQQFCQCCSLPIETKGVIEPYSFCSNTDEFVECGIGTSLYFYFFQFSIIILLIAFFVVSVPQMILSVYYTNQLNDFCGEIFDFFGGRIPDFIFYCNRFLLSDGYYEQDEDWAMRFNLDSLRFYIGIFRNASGETERESLAHEVTVNHSIMNFICLLTLFIVNLMGIIHLRNKSNSNNLKNVSPSDYTLYCTGMNKFFNAFVKDYEKEQLNAVLFYI